MPFKLGAIWAAIKLDTTQFNAAIKHVQGQTAATGKTATGTGTAMGGMWKKMAVGVGIAGGVTLAVRMLKNQFSDMVTTGREFESEWANVTTMMNSSGEEARQMRDELINLSPTLGSTTDLARGMYQVLSASIPEDAAILFLESAAEAAVAGVTDTATAVDALTTVINAYGLEAGDVTSISDVMFETVKSGKLTYAELAASLGTVISPAASTGVKFTEISAALAEMTKKGIPAQTATMQLRQVLMGILAPSTGAAENMDKLGIAYGENALQTQGLAGWLVQLREKTGGSADAIAGIIENARSLTGVLALTGTGTEGLTDAVADMEGALDGGGQTATAFEKQLSTMDITIETLVTASDKFKISFYNGFVEGIEKGVPSAKDFDEITRDLNDAFRTLGEVLGSTVIPAITDWKNKLDSIIKPIKGVKLALSDTVKMIKAGYFPTLKNLNKMYDDQAEAEKESAKWVEFLSGWMVKGADAMQGLTDKVNAQIDATGKSTAAHKTLIPEIETTKNEFIEWLMAVADGKMTIDEYNMRIDGMSDSFINLAKDLKDAEVLDPEDLEPYFTELESMPDATLSVFNQIGLQSLDLKTEIEKHAEDMTKVTLPAFWQNFATSVGTIYGDLIWDLMDKNSTFDESITNLFDNFANMFKSMIADMVQTFVTDFVGGILSGAQDAASGILSSLGSALGGGGAGDIAGGVESVVGSLGGLANPINMISGAVTAIASVAALFKKTGPSSTDSWHFQETWKEQKQLTDYTMINIGGSGGWLAKIHDKTNAVVLKNEYMMKQNRKSIGILGDISKHTSATVKAIKEMTPKKAQAGAVSLQSELIQTHGTPQHPEYIIPHQDLSNMMSGQGGGGGGGGTTNYISINISDQIDPFTAQRMTREVILPQIIAALGTKDFNRDLQRGLGISR